ncbi:helix-turn-helix transcriptional regulator [uncultured Bradyrhizobium sp.]|uniref:helix-turn-helix transcriptional regulator n=1 Tax=uncultured Bradyrhizobium sp. TaxID=199684 RepID=UPI003458B25E
MREHWCDASTPRLSKRRSLTYLQHLLIDTARPLLELGDLTVQQIADQVGYGDTSSFARLFRERVGLSPGAYRRRFRPENGIEPSSK